MKFKRYRVELFNDSAPIKGMESDFGDFKTLFDAKNWAVDIGFKGGATYVRLFVKSEVRYNHYNFLCTLFL